MEIFKKMGPRVILVEHRGKVTGLVTVKDCLKYQFKVEAEEHTLAATSSSEFGALGGHLDSPAPETLEDRLWRLIQNVAGFVSGKVSGRPVRPRGRNVPRQSEPADIIEGRDDDAVVELEDREDRPMIP